jgi:hypothetical protein
MGGGFYGVKASGRRGEVNKTHMSRGYTIAFAMTAPVAPATARPHGGIRASFDCPAIATGDGEEVGFRVYECCRSGLREGFADKFSVFGAWGGGLWQQNHLAAFSQSTGNDTTGMLKLKKEKKKTAWWMRDCISEVVDNLACV